MKFGTLAKAFSEIETISSRVEITQKLAALLQDASAQEAKIIAYLSSGVLRPSYEGTQFNLAERSLRKILAQLLEVSEEKLATLANQLGDLGDVAAHGTWSPHTHLTVEQVYDVLIELESVSGSGSQEKRSQDFQKLLRSVTPAESGVIVRMVLGKLRLGFSDMTFIDALSWMMTGDKSLHDRIENAYNVCADLGHIAYLLKLHGQKAFEKVAITVGIPIRPAAAERLPTAEDIIEKVGACVAQPKIDGFRLQIHIDATSKETSLWFFSRNLLNMSAMFPDLVHDLHTLPVKSCIIEGEAIAYDEQTDTFAPFQETVKRKRKHEIEAAAKELPLKFFMFDILYLNGESMLDHDQHTRRELLLDLVKKHTSDRIEVIPERHIATAKELEAYFLETVGAGLEGLVIKKPRAHYQPGKRNFNWIKLKRQEQGDLEDTLDAVVLGYYVGKGKRAKFGIGAFLVGVYNKKEDTFETVAKIGTGLGDAEWIALKEKCDKIAVKHQPRQVVCAKGLVPHVWVLPELVVQIRADEITQSPIHTAAQTKEGIGLALRFPRIMGYRIDKSATEATTVTELRELYEHQVSRKKS